MAAKWAGRQHGPNSDQHEPETGVLSQAAPSCAPSASPNICSQSPRLTISYLQLALWGLTGPMTVCLCVCSCTAMKSLCSLNMNSTKLSADTYEDLKVSPSFILLPLASIEIVVFCPHGGKRV